ncbi:hypothetical protein [Syntrophomonas palmitatica]|uniref:hypothetical protein n=1 Tax=Syntrophomonas palmitatica TaxID=402877 RepID=UPI0006CFDAFC|nr:hypothetical protein [Syntrophomonas palmitatica]
MSKSIFLRPDGTIEGLYTDAIPLQKLGKLTVTRATTVEFDDARQEWLVALPDGQEIYSNASREVALEWEKTYCEAQLIAGFRPGAS